MHLGTNAFEREDAGAEHDRHIREPDSAPRSAVHLPHAIMTPEVVVVCLHVLHPPDLLQVT